MSELRAGFGYLVQGQRWVGRHGRQYGFGLLPGLITLVLYVAALLALAFWADEATAWATPFADDWSSPWLGLFRGTLTVLLWVLALFLAVISFTAVTLLMGQPFYEALAERVERSEGGEVHGSGLPLWRELWISGRDSLRILARVTLYGILLFAACFIPGSALQSSPRSDSASPDSFSPRSSRRWRCSGGASSSGSDWCCSSGTG